MTFFSQHVKALESVVSRFSDRSSSVSGHLLSPVYSHQFLAVWSIARLRRHRQCAGVSARLSAAPRQPWTVTQKKLLTAMSPWTTKVNWPCAAMFAMFRLARKKRFCWSAQTFCKTSSSPHDLIYRICRDVPSTRTFSFNFECRSIGLGYSLVTTTFRLDMLILHVCLAFSCVC